MKNYRKIYESHFQCSLLPGIDIHHIDGNHNNNHPLNLRAVTLEEHYNIHKEQKEYYAAYLIGRRLLIKPADWSEMARLNGYKSGKLNYAKGIGLKGWIDNNRDNWLKMLSANGKKSGKKVYEEKLGFHSASKEKRKEWAKAGGKKASDLGLGFKLGHASSAGKIGGKKGGEYARENKTGIFALTPEQNKQRHMNSVISRLIKNGKASAWPRRI
jgi:hypothetical protein